MDPLLGFGFNNGEIMMMMLTSAIGKFNYEESKVFAPGNLRRDAKKPRSFRMLCSDSNPTTDHDVPFVSSRDASITRCYFRPIDVLYEQFCLMVVILTVHYCRREDQEIEKRKGSRGRCTLLLLMNSTCA
ncbi:hypothetical protein LINPERPRIM_LOCUS11996 [Linum perenne]